MTGTDATDPGSNHGSGGETGGGADTGSDPGGDTNTGSTEGEGTGMEDDDGATDTGGTDSGTDGEDSDGKSWAWGEQFVEYAEENYESYVDQGIADVGSTSICARLQHMLLVNHPTTGDEFGDRYTVTVTEGPASEACSLQLECQLEKHGFSPHQTGRTLLRKGDIMFTTDSEPFAGALWPNHTYTFIEWVDEDVKDEAYVIDQHGWANIRSLTGDGPNDFGFFMRHPSMPWDGLDLDGGYD